MRELEELELSIRESDAPDRKPVDFTIEDDVDNVAWVWGDADSYEVECNHPHIEWEDDETQGYCPLCGKYCDWHREVADEYGHLERVPHQWYEGDGGAIKKIVKEKYGRQN